MSTHAGYTYKLAHKLEEFSFQKGSEHNHISYLTEHNGINGPTTLRL